MYFSIPSVTRMSSLVQKLLSVNYLNQELIPGLKKAFIIERWRVRGSTQERVAHTSSIWMHAPWRGGQKTTLSRLVHLSTLFVSAPLSNCEKLVLKLLSEPAISAFRLSVGVLEFQMRTFTSASFSSVLGLNSAHLAAPRLSFFSRFQTAWFLQHISPVAI